jgi:hypothetical protein
MAASALVMRACDLTLCTCAPCVSRAPTVRTVTPVRRRKPVITSSKCASNKRTPGYHILIGIFIAAAVVDNADDGSGFDANHAWMYATWLTIGYMISRGLAKSGRSTRERRNDRD